MPPGIFPPSILRYNASSVPILQIGLSSDTLSRAGALRLRAQLHPHAARHGAGRHRSAALRRQAAADHGRSRPARRCTPKGSPPPTSADAINAQNLIFPPAPPRSGAREYSVQLNSSPDVDRRVQRHADQAGERRDRLHPRRGAGARRLRRADQRGARRTAAAPRCSRCSRAAALPRSTSWSASRSRPAAHPGHAAAAS